MSDFESNYQVPISSEPITREMPIITSETGASALFSRSSEGPEESAAFAAPLPPGNMTMSREKSSGERGLVAGLIGGAAIGALAARRRVRRDNRRGFGGNRHSLKSKAVACVAVGAIGLVAFDHFDNKNGGAKTDVTVQSDRVTVDSSQLKIAFADIYTDPTFVMINKQQQHFVPSGLRWLANPKSTVTDKYPTQYPGYDELGIVGNLQVTTTNVSRKGNKKHPQSSREVTLTLNRGDLTGTAVPLTSAPEGKPNTVVVKDNKDVMFQGSPVPLKDQKFVFAKNGTYNLGTPNLGGKDSDKASFYEAFLHFGHYDFSKGAHTAQEHVGQILLQAPTCLEAAFQQESLDNLVKSAFEQALVNKRYNPTQVDIKLTGQWPAADEIPNDNGQDTFQSEVGNLNSTVTNELDSLPGKTSLTVAPTCTLLPGVGGQPTYTYSSSKPKSK